MSGQVLQGKYTLIRRLARGGMSDVWLARDEARGAEVAIKVVRLEGASDEARAAVRARAEREAAIAARLARATEHVVAVLDHGEEGGASLLVMERLLGMTLDAQLAQHGPLPLQAVVAIAGQIASGLAVAHRHGVVHCDVKPANLFATRGASGAPLVKLLDFGLAHETGGDRSGLAAAPAGGTPSYMSLEHRAGARPSPSFDAWALAVTLFELLAGSLPWEGDGEAARLVAMEARARRSVASVRPDLPESINGFFDAAFAPDGPIDDVVSLSEAFARAATGSAR